MKSIYLFFPKQEEENQVGVKKLLNQYGGPKEFPGPMFVWMPEILMKNKKSLGPMP